MSNEILKVDLIESNGSLNVFVTNTSDSDYAFIAEISVTIGNGTSYHYGPDFQVGGRMIPPGLGQSKLILHTGGNKNYSAQVHYWVADQVAAASS
ncbi:hypothetical protein [Aquimarina sp. 2201CG5-10]|uniref:hypothetical protein n=1 Tax=Aquimarina callyspongiae TaxID=3098150 RepID=UPI002AB36A7A|nr:hypothetical protein [Aquimarina sp. 2201CG5-10]MDY8138132.1 hypothetical protein [Aquimarina sp. 2201CG5-10]